MQTPRYRFLTVLAIAVLAHCPSTFAAAPPQRMEPVVERVRLVLLPTTVTTRRGKIVRGLEAKDFRLLEEGEEREIDLFSTEDELPVSLAFLVDVSASMGLRDRIGLAKAAISRIVDGLDSGDRVALIRFADGAVDWESGFDEDRATFRRRLAALEADGRTALYDALAATPRMVADQARGRKAIVLVTDGVDNASELPQLRATWMARGVAVPIYTIGFIPMREKLLAERAREALRTVERFSTETGGTLFPVHSEEDLDRASSRIDKELRFQYLIGFYPEGGGQRDLFRDLELTTKRSGLRVRTRSGYYPNR